jgi:hypothetical protein
MSRKRKFEPSKNSSSLAGNGPGVGAGGLTKHHLSTTSNVIIEDTCFLQRRKKMSRSGRLSARAALVVRPLAANPVL